MVSVVYSLIVGLLCVVGVFCVVFSWSYKTVYLHFGGFQVDSSCF